MSAPSPRTTSQPPKLVHLALNALCRNWSSATVLDGLSTDLAKLVWAHVKDHHARQGITPVPCAAMYPLVRASWQIQTLDLSDAGKWITDTALQALAYLPSLRSVRLTACKFVSNDGLAPLAALPAMVPVVAMSVVSASASVRELTVRTVVLSDLVMAELRTSLGRVSPTAAV